MFLSINTFGPPVRYLTRTFCMKMERTVVMKGSTHTLSREQRYVYLFGLKNEPVPCLSLTFLLGNVERP